MFLKSVEKIENDRVKEWGIFSFCSLSVYRRVNSQGNPQVCSYLPGYITTGVLECQWLGGEEGL